jgi:Ca2+-binding EF-hand superfamily protein
VASRRSDGRESINFPRSKTMSNTISGVGAYSATALAGIGLKHRDPTAMAEDLFSQIDTSGKGYIDKTDLENAFQRLPSSSSTSADQVFLSLDSNSDGKITKQEMLDGIKELAAALDTQFQRMRMSNAMGGMAAMPPPLGNDVGFTKDQLQSQLNEIGSTDSKRSRLLSNIIQNFNAADTNGDGKVSFAEAMAYDQSSSTGSAKTSTDTSTTVSDAQLMLKIIQLSHAYGRQSAAVSGVSATA